MPQSAPRGKGARGRGDAATQGRAGGSASFLSLAVSPRRRVSFFYRRGAGAAEKFFEIL
jgi:hypothetical protein